MHVKKGQFQLSSPFVFTGILGFDVFLDENGDVRQNFTVMAFSEQGGEKSVCLYSFFFSVFLRTRQHSLFNSS